MCAVLSAPLFASQGSAVVTHQLPGVMLHSVPVGLSLRPRSSLKLLQRPHRPTAWLQERAGTAAGDARCSVHRHKVCRRLVRDHPPASGVECKAPEIGADGRGGAAAQAQRIAALLHPPHLHGACGQQARGRQRMPFPSDVVVKVLTLRHALLAATLPARHAGEPCQRPPCPAPATSPIGTLCRCTAFNSSQPRSNPGGSNSVRPAAAAAACACAAVKKRQCSSHQVPSGRR